MSEITQKKPGNGVLAIWQKPDKIRKLFAPTLTNDEFMFFIGLGKSMGANPFKREIWAVKYDDKKPASIFLGRDFNRKKAQEQPNYDMHTVDAVYSGDEFKVCNGVPEHSYNLKNRGNLLGAYCVVFKTNSTKPFFVFVELSEYDKGHSNWKTMKATMIKKVAEAQALRMAFQDVFAGTYDESEEDVIQYQATGQGKPEPTKYDTPPPKQENGTGKDPKGKPSKEDADNFNTEMMAHFKNSDLVEQFLAGVNEYVTDVSKIKSYKQLGFFKGKFRALVKEEPANNAESERPIIPEEDINDR